MEFELDHESTLWGGVLFGIKARDGTRKAVKKPCQSLPLGEGDERTRDG